MSIFEKRLEKLEKLILPKKKVYPQNIQDCTDQELLELAGFPDGATDEQLLELSGRNKP